MLDGRRIESLPFTHPLRDVTTVTVLGHNAIMRNAMDLLLSIGKDDLTVQGMVGVVNDDLITLMIGSMAALRSADPSKSSSIWLATPTGWPSLTSDSLICKTVKSVFVTRITQTSSELR